MYLNDSSAIITPVITVHYMLMENNTIPHPLVSTASHLSLPFVSCTNSSLCISATSVLGPHKEAQEMSTAGLGDALGTLT